MIVFEGKIYGECKKKLLKKETKIQFFVSLITSIIFSFFITLATVFADTLFALFFIPILMLLVFSALPPSKKAQKTFVPIKIFIDLEEQTIVHQCEKTERFHMLNSVERVLDYGEFYELIFQFEDRDPYFVCQKSLLTEGTLEEFEALFEGKIERQKK